MSISQAFLIFFLLYLRDYLFFLFSALVEHLAIFPRFNIQFVGRYTDTSRTCRVSEWKFHELAHAVVCFWIRLVPQLSLFFRVGDFFAKLCLSSNAQVRARRKRDSCHSADIHHPRGWHIIPTSIHFARSIISRTRVCIDTYRSVRQRDTPAILLAVIKLNRWIFYGSRYQRHWIIKRFMEFLAYVD